MDAFALSSYQLRSFFDPENGATLSSPRLSNVARYQSASQMQSSIPNTMSAKHPNFPELSLLVFEAVLEVVCVSLAGYIAARRGLFDAEFQKLLANLNTVIFTPCLSRFS
jgi:hypothetical protein